jgi:hypothetical protein
MAVHDPPCRSVEEHITVSQERDEIGWNLERWALRMTYERDQEMAAIEAERVFREEANAENELELRYAWGDR